MAKDPVNNLNVLSQDLLPTPQQVKSALPLTDKAQAAWLQGRETVRRILDREDPRLFVVIGPCSIHDIKAAHEYAKRLKRLAEEGGDTLYLIMRVHIEKGLHLARELLLHLAEMGLPAATEALDPITPQYLSDLITWTAIGARTTESQTHREMDSG